MEWFEVDHRSYGIPYMRNTKPIAKYEALKIYAPTAIYVPLQSVASVSGGGKRQRIRKNVL